MSDLIKLGEIAQDTFKNLQLERLYKKLSERAQEIKDAPEYQQMDFYCDECEKDFGGVGHKEIRLPKGSVFFAFYRTFCPDGHIATRRITDKIADPYFFNSPFIHAQQKQFEDAMIGPDNPRFKFLYPEAHKKLKSGEFEREFTT